MALPALFGDAVEANHSERYKLIFNLPFYAVFYWLGVVGLTTDSENTVLYLTDQMCSSIASLCQNSCTNCHMPCAYVH